MNGPLFAVAPRTRMAADQLVGHIAAHVEAALRDDPRDVVEFTEQLRQLARLDPVTLRRMDAIFASALLACRLAAVGEPESDIECARRTR